MIHNDILRSVRYMLDISDKKVVEIIKLGGMDVELKDVVAYLDKKKKTKKASCAARTRSWRTFSMAW